MNRREFLKRAFWIATGVGIPWGGYCSWLQTRRWVMRHYTLFLPDLPLAWEGSRVVFIADFHHSWYFEVEKIQEAVEAIHSLDPDIVLLGGDYVHYGYKVRHYLDSVFEVLKALRAREGVFGVLGNHDAHENLSYARERMIRAGITDLSNAFTRLIRKGETLRLAGLSDVNTEVPRSDRAELNQPTKECTLLVTHNPDVFEHLREYVHYSFAFAGHTHGGQVYIPGFGAPIISSAFGQKYRYGFIRTYTGTVYVTSGYGSAFPPVRFFCPPEICLFILKKEGNAS